MTVSTPIAAPSRSLILSRSHSQVCGIILLLTVLLVGSLSPTAMGRDSQFAAKVKLAQADGFYEVGDYESALPIYRAVTVAQPTSGRAWLGTGKCLNRLDREQEAIEPLKRAVETSDDQLTAWNELGNSCTAIENYKDAEFCYTKSLESGDDSVVFYNRGWTRRLLGKYDEALQDFNQAIAMDDTDADFFNERGLIYWEWEDWHKAASDFCKSASMNADNEVFTHNYCDAIEQLKAWNAMVDSAKAILRKCDTNSEAHYMKAYGLLETNRPSEAKRSIDRAIQLNDQEPTFFELRARIQRKLGNEGGARRDERQAEMLQG